MPSKLVNFEFLRENTFGNNTFMLELIDLFTKTTTPLINDLKVYCKAEDWKQLGQIAHKLKSNYSILGITQVETLLNQLEAYDGNGNDKKAICASIDDMGTLTEMVYKELAAEVEILKK